MKRFALLLLAMKRFALLLLVLCHLAFAGPDDVNFSQRNSTDTGNVTRIPTHPLSAGLLWYDATTLQPYWSTLGSGLAMSPSGVLSATAAAQVNSDWNASSGVAQILNKPSIPAAQVNSDWNASSGVAQILNKPTIPTVTAFNFGAVNTRTLTIGTAFQALDPTKAAVVTLSPSCGATLTLSGGTTCTMQARVGTSSLTCSTGSVVATWTNGNTGALTIGLSLTQTIAGPGAIFLPIGAYAILCATSGTFTLTTAVDQSAG